jgi:protein-disulfide isomerase
LSRIHLFAALLALSLSASLLAQTAAAPATPTVLSETELNRRIVILIRSQFNIPAEFEISVGARGPSTLAGFDTLAITLARGEQKSVIEFLISRDNQTLARLESFSLTKAPVFTIDVAGRPVRGNPAAKVTLVDFDDLECPVCARMHHTLFPTILERYKDRVRFAYLDNPLVELHPWAMHAAVDANCLAAQSGDAYWDYVDYVHGHGQEIDGEEREPAKSFATLDRIAHQQGALSKLNDSQLQECLTKQDESPVNASLKQAAALRLNFAPAVYINGERIEGYVPAEQIEKVIERALRDAGN